MSNSSPPALGPVTANRPKLTRAERGQAIRQSLFDAAAAVVGKEGYAAAMISMITAQANVAQGTFYNYFESRQDLFDQLLPQIGIEMLDYIRQETAGTDDGLLREEKSFRAFFAFLKMRPEFYRILYEAELFAPVAFERHRQTTLEGYMRNLQRASKQGVLHLSKTRDLEATALMLMGIRHYLCMRYVRKHGETITLPEWLVRLYVTLITEGLYARPDLGPAR